MLIRFPSSFKKPKRPLNLHPLVSNVEDLSMTVVEVQFFSQATCPNFICPRTKNTHTSPINYFGPSKIFPILLSKLGPHKYFLYNYQSWATKLYHLYKSPNSFILLVKPKKPYKPITKSVATGHLL